MLNVARRSLRQVPRLCLPAQRSAGQRLPIKAAKTFHTSSPHRTTWPGPSKPADAADHEQTPAGRPAARGARAAGTSSEESTKPTAAGVSARDPVTADQQSKSATTSSAARKAARAQPQQQKWADIDPVCIPPWFYERNVRLRDEPHVGGRGRLEIVSSSGEGKHVDGLGPAAASGASNSMSPGAAIPAVDVDDGAPTYRLSAAIMAEVTSSVAAGLSLSQAELANSFPAEKSHIKLHCPIDGGVYFLEKVVERVGQQLGADVIRIDAQDIAEIAGDYINEGRDATSNALWTLGYDTQHVFSAAHQEMESDEPAGEADESEALEDAVESRGRRSGWTTMAVIPGMASGGTLNLGNLMKSLTQRGEGIKAMFEGGGRPGGRNGGNDAVTKGARSRWDEHKLMELLKLLLETNVDKRAAQAGSRGEETKTSDDTDPDAPIPNRTIVLIRGVKELSATAQGGLILDRMFDVVVKKRKEGQEIVFVGTTSSVDLTPEISKAGIRSLQSEAPDLPYRTIIVAPEAAGPAGGIYYLEERRRIREINVRHLQDMVYRMSASQEPRTMDHMDFAQRLEFGAGQEALEALLEEQYLSLDEVHRIILLAIGMHATKQQPAMEASAAEGVGVADIVSAMQLIDDSDAAKVEWAKNERQLRRAPTDPEAPKPSAADTLLKRLRKNCNRHEKSLLGGVVKPENIRTTFSDVHAPAETIEALKTLTTLSLTRPDAFKYGVLAKDKITGVLLYGPPGTGKTLLAKAVAKESGATVLEVSGSDVYDMYVGESEKNVRAIFSLAKKLSPCVVFIDEADAIFASRGSGTNRNSHRELINQFLREWDGMTDTSAFIMVATNRPFDLDDAALRRLPRRLLVDLPVEKDREAILGIHLKDENLDASVSLAQLASQTPLYSGSDLKNLAVAAALAAVREENVELAKHAGEQDYSLPDRRVLHRRHFDMAMGEISASVNEDMSSLGAIRKFDERYGDRRGRRKKSTYGFGSERGAKEQTVKVRPTRDT